MAASGTPPVKRKLAAILAADAVGYSRMMAADEEGTVRLLQAHRAVIDGIIEFHEGRIVNTAGDSVIAEFASPVQAVRCAVEIQDALRTRNDSLPEGERLQFRIGVNLGDVMVKGDDLLGDGVNVAARIESITDPGGISVSSSVYDQIAGKLDLGFIDAGNKSLKNIDRPVRVYRVERTGARRSARTRRRSPALGWLVGAAVVLAIAAGTWHMVWVPMQEAEQRAAAEASAAREAELARMRAEAEAERRRLEDEAAKEKAKAEAARRQAEAEAARQRAAAESARRQAEARAAEAAQAKRALEAQRAAEARARAEADVARLRAEAEDARRKAAAELAAAEEARRKAQEAGAAAAPSVSLREGSWAADLNCPAFRDAQARNFSMPLIVDGDGFRAEFGDKGEPGSLFLRGFVNSDGSVLFRGSGVTGRRGGSRQYKAGFAVHPAGAGYEGSGRLGGRECRLMLTRTR